MSGYLDAMRRYATFRGRTSRDDFLRAQWVFLPLAALSFGVVGLPFVGDDPGLGSRSIWPMVFFVLIVLPHAVPWAALMVRRLHDMDRSGAWAFLALIPLGLIVPFPMVGLVIWGAQPGTLGPNRFGPAPLGSEPHDAVRSPASLGATVPSAPATSDRNNVVAELERLASLRANGTLSDAEFKVLKAQVLTQGGGA